MKYIQLCYLSGTIYVIDKEGGYFMKIVNRDMILNLPISVNSWNILNEYVHENADFDVFYKIFKEYSLECSLKCMMEILILAEQYFEREKVNELFAIYLETSSESK